MPFGIVACTLFPTTFLEIAGNPKCAEVAGPDQRAAKQMRPGTVQINHSLPKVNLSVGKKAQKSRQMHFT